MMEGNEPREETGVWGKGFKMVRTMPKVGKERRKREDCWWAVEKLHASRSGRQGWRQTNHKNKQHRENMELSSAPTQIDENKTPHTPVRNTFTQGKEKLSPNHIIRKQKINKKTQTIPIAFNHWKRSSSDPFRILRISWSCGQKSFKI